MYKTYMKFFSSKIEIHNSVFGDFRVLSGVASLASIMTAQILVVFEILCFL